MKYAYEKFKMKIDEFFETSGDGFYSDKCKPVKIIRIEVPHIDKDFSFGELRVYFDPDYWKIVEDNFIYTDPGFLRDVISFANREIGNEIDDIAYSEYHMQGDDYVSFDVGENFLRVWVDLVVRRSNSPPPP